MADITFVRLAVLSRPIDAGMRLRSAPSHSLRDSEGIGFTGLVIADDRRAVMNDRDKLNAKCRQDRKLARQMTDQRMVEVLEELAREYEQAAEGQPHGRSPSAHGEGPGSSSERKDPS